MQRKKILLYKEILLHNSVTLTVNSLHILFRDTVFFCFILSVKIIKDYSNISRVFKLFGLQDPLELLSRKAILSGSNTMTKTLW